jgi:hypothetical protein
VFFDNVHVNAMSELRIGYYAYGETPELKYMKKVLADRGVVSTPPRNYGEDCCLQ